MHQSPDTGRLNLSTQAEGATTLERLREHIRTLVTVDETEAPMLSCYLGITAGYRQGLQARVRALRRSLARHEREPFEEALSQIESFLDSGILPGTKGLAAFARSGSRPFFLPLQFQLPLPNRLSIDSTPNIYDLVELKDTYHRYVVMIATEKRARILEVNLGAVTKEIWAERPELRQRVGREWTRDQYQNHSRDRADRFIKEKVEILDRLMSQGGQTHLILAGSPPLAARPAQGPLSRAHVEPATASSPRARSRAAGAC